MQQNRRSDSLRLSLPVALARLGNASRRVAGFTNGDCARTRGGRECRESPLNSGRYLWNPGNPCTCPLPPMMTIRAMVSSYAFQPSIVQIPLTCTLPHSERGSEAILRFWLVGSETSMKSGNVSRRELIVGGLAALLYERRSTPAFATATQPATPVSFKVPTRTCDCHTHIFDDPQRFAFWSERP